MKNKFVAIALALTTLVWAFPTSAATTAELQAQIAALLQQITALQAQLGGTTPSTTSACFTKLLKVGMTDAEVTALQNSLKGDVAIYPQGLVTGYFGSLTEAAVKKFQAKYGYEQVGYTGPLTRAKLNALYCTTTPTGTTTPTPVGGGVSVILASDTPAAASVIYDTASTSGAQALAPFTKLVFTAGTTAAKVTSVKLLRSGISTDSDINNVYLYEGNTKLAELTSISSNVITFSDTAGLFTIPAGTSKTITVKADIANSTSATGKTMRLGINAATDITVEGATAAGVFPIYGNYMTWAGITDLGQFTFSSQTYPTSVDPSTTVERELWRMTSTAQNQKIQLQYMKFTMIGTASYTDFKDLKLTVGAKVYGPVDMASDKTVTFDISSDPYLYESGQTKNIALSGKVIGGASRSYYFAVQNRADVVVYDANYNVYLKPNKLDTYTIIKAAGNTSINSGSLNVSKSTDTPTGSIALNATSVTLAKFDFAAAGENVKVSALEAGLVCSSSTTAAIKNVKLLVDGSQIGTTDASVLCNGDSISGIGTLGNTFQITAGQTKVVSIVADMTVASDMPHAAETITAKLYASSTDNYWRMTAGTTGTTAAVDGNALTLRAGAVTVAKNISVPSGSATNPTSVTGASDQRIGSFTVTAGLGEAVDVTQFVIKDIVGDFPTYYSNLKLKDSSGNQLGSIYGTLTATAATTYAFVPSTAIRINAGQQTVFNVYADVKSGLTAGAAATTSVSAIYATGVSTSQTADDTTSAPTLQTVYVSAKGTLTVSVDAATPIAQQVVNGKTYEFARYKFAAGTPENIRMTDLVVNLNSTADANIADLTEFKLYDVTGGAKTLIAGPVYSAVENATNDWNGYVTFPGFTDTITKGTNKIYSVEAKVGSWQTGTSGVTQQFIIGSDYIHTNTDTSTSTPITAYGAQSNAQLLESDATLLVTGTNASANAMTIYRTKPAVVVASDSPTAAISGGEDQTIYKFTLSNESNEGTYSANVTGILMTINASNLSEAADAATATRTFTLYKDSIATANVVGELVLKSNVATTSASTYGGVLNFGTTAAIVSGFSNYVLDSSTAMVSTEIAAGGSKTFILVADIAPKTVAANDSTLSISIGSTGMFWTDGEDVNINAVDTLPLAAKNVTVN
jgi:peptidoglycan hydrolase-like protein with peptidoglycan-binding domain